MHGTDDLGDRVEYLERQRRLDAHRLRSLERERWRDKHPTLSELESWEFKRGDLWTIAVLLIIAAAFVVSSIFDF